MAAEKDARGGFVRKYSVIHSKEECLSPAVASRFVFRFTNHVFIPLLSLLASPVVCCVLCVMGMWVCVGAPAQVRDKFNQQMDWDKHLSKKDLRRAEREQLAFLKVQL